MPMSTASRLALSILNGCNAVFSDFQNTTVTATVRFEQAQWPAVHEASRRRMGMYKRKVYEILDVIYMLAGDDEVHDLALWRETKACYIRLLARGSNYEIAESFYNSIFCNIFKHEHLTDEFAFVLSTREQDATVADDPIYSSYYMKSSLHALIGEVLDDYAFSIPYEDKPRDVRRIVDIVKTQILKGKKIVPAMVRVDVMDPVFYRNKGAYLVGRLFLGEDIVPMVLPLLHNEKANVETGAKGEVYVDTLLCDEEDVSIVFSFTRSYFMVDALEPSKVVAFLESLMPHKTHAELYSCIGYKKHSKTVFYRDFIEHLANSDDELIIAPGIKGMVMSVFTLPSYGIVFKIIKDKFAAPKTVTKEIVKEKYKLVTRHDRVGRMADTQEFSNLSLDLSRFSSELLKELKAVAPSILTFTEDKIIFQHIYTERRMVPLNLYLADINDEQTLDVMDEYGNAIKQLAAANIFPGDMLLKNFGVTRHGRVVFYDYDELCHLTECNFRRIPEPKTEEQAMSSSPWYTVAENDIFPEEFRLFFSGNPRARKAFEALHGELYEVAYWQGLQDDILAGQVMDVFPYRRKKRFERDLKLE